MPMKPDDIELDMLAAMMPGGVELQEALGQQKFVESATLPVRGLEWEFGYKAKYSTSPKEYLESLGFIFGEIDDIFINVQLPEGWKIEASDHSMWSDLKDNNNCVRASIFYKAAFYDRSADFSLTRRYYINEVYVGDEGFIKDTLRHRVVDSSTGKTVYITAPRKFAKEYDDEYWELHTASEEDVRAWLDDNYPEAYNPMAYWND